MSVITVCLMSLAIMLSCGDKHTLPTGGGGGDDPGGGDPPIDGETVTSLTAFNARVIARVTGVASAGENYYNPNNTSGRFNLGTTDMGVMWVTGQDEIMMAFGDNFSNTTSNANLQNWRSNALAISTDKMMTDGLYIDRMVTSPDGKMKELIQPASGDVTCIPLGGVCVDNRQYIFYMAVKQWATDGADAWADNYGGIAYSDDYGQSWVKSDARWDGTGNFAQGCFLRKDGYVYLYGMPAGRKGMQLCLARVTENSVLSKSDYEYWNGSTWVKGQENSAAPITNGEVSEMTVMYNRYYERYIMMYLSVKSRAVVMRDAASPEGEWSAEKIVVFNDKDNAYAPVLHPWFDSDKDLYFLESHPSPVWNIFLSHARLKEDVDGFNIVSEGGFEEYPANPIGYRTHWDTGNSVASSDAHIGSVACRLDVETTQRVWNDVCTQIVAVKPNTDYTLTAYAKSSGVLAEGDAYLGIRNTDNTVVSDKSFPVSAEWTQMSVTFNSRDNTKVKVFFGLWADGNVSVSIDDIHLQPKQKEQ